MDIFNKELFKITERNTLYHVAQVIYSSAIYAVLPDNSVRHALSRTLFREKITLVAIGKAAWRMAYTGHCVLGEQITEGLVITKYGHSQGSISNFEIYEAGHPIVDERSLVATSAVLHLIERAKSRGDEILFLVSGGGSALFEAFLPGITLDYIHALNLKLLTCGADIHEINTIRKLFSAVKGGRFAEFCAPMKIFQFVLSDVIGDDLSVIASGPAAPYTANARQVQSINKKYNLCITKDIINGRHTINTPNVTTEIVANGKSMCEAAAQCAKKLGYRPYIMDCAATGNVKEVAERIFADALLTLKDDSMFSRPCALIYGGETTVHVKGSGKGGRNQELALLMAKNFTGLEGILFFSCGSDGTDGSTDAAGGIIDGSTWKRIKDSGANPCALLDDNDSNSALAVADALIITGPSGTNVNDLMVILSN